MVARAKTLGLDRHMSLCSEKSDRLFKIPNPTFFLFKFIHALILFLFEKYSYNILIIFFGLWQPSQDLHRFKPDKNLSTEKGKWTQSPVCLLCKGWKSEVKRHFASKLGSEDRGVFCSSVAWSRYLFGGYWRQLSHGSLPNGVSTTGYLSPGWSLYLLSYNISISCLVSHNNTSIISLAL